MAITRKEVQSYLDDVKRAVNEHRYTVSPRDKNEQLFRDYVFTEKKREEILLALSVEDFCEVLDNEHPRFAHEKLYVFGKDVLLLPRYGHGEKLVSLYIKFNKLENLFCIIISFHEQEHPLGYVFR